MRARRWLAALFATSALACSDAPTTPTDGGPSDTGPAPDGRALCRADADCSDGLFCNGVERCVADGGGGDARGCAPPSVTSPCAAGETCDETSDRCQSACADGDGDGHLAVSCGGDDCDDTDAHRFPGNTEVCAYSSTTMLRVDPTHDEDCNPMTYANGAARDGDHDDDGFVDSACSNTDGTHVYQGGDCADTAPADPTAPFTTQIPAANVHPTESERCNGVDDDCNGMIDDGLASGTYYPDCDGDNFGDASATGTVGCQATACNGHAAVLDHRDCDDASNVAHPGQAEVCDGVDNDCNGTIDDAATVDTACQAMFPGTMHGSVACNTSTHACALSCATNFANCDGSIANGCEVDLQSDRANCGSCGAACGLAATCDARVCDHLSRIDAGAAHTCGLYSRSGHAVCWGANNEGQLGDGTRTNRLTATPVSGPLGGGILSFAYLSAGGARSETDLGTTDAGHTCAGTSAEMYCWGTGADGQLGNSLLGSVSVPTLVANIPAPATTSTGTPTLVGVSAGTRFTIGLQREPQTVGGTAVLGFQQWAWGLNGGRYGTAAASSNVPVATILTTTTASATIPAITSFAAGYQSLCYVTSAGNRLYCSGGTAGGSSTPVLMTLPSGWAGVAEVSANGMSGFGPPTQRFYGHEQVCARRAGASGPVYCWGIGGLIPGLTDATQVAAGARHACALRATGQVVCWGDNQRGTLGGDSPPPPIPGDLPDGTTHVVHGLSNVIQITAGTEHTCAMLSDYSVWCWGENDRGQLGNGTTGTSSLPVQVLGL